MAECEALPTPRPPHHEAGASDVTPISAPSTAPATKAAYPSPVWTRWWSWRAGMKMIGLRFAASSTLTTLVVISVRGAGTPRETGSGGGAGLDGLEVGEGGVVAVDRQYSHVRLDPVAVVERAHGQVIPVLRAQLQ